MTAHPLNSRGITGCALVLTLALFAAASTSQASTSIYKCFDKNLSLVYTDQPCKDGEHMDIRAGDADPKAVARVERARDALDASAEQRIAEQRRAALQPTLAAPYVNDYEPGGYDYAAAPAAYDYGVIGYPSGYPSGGRHHRPRNLPPNVHEHRRVAPTNNHTAHRR